jgi:hypothetical protein
MINSFLGPLLLGFSCERVCTVDHIRSGYHKGLSEYSPDNMIVACYQKSSRMLGSVAQSAT